MTRVSDEQRAAPWRFQYAQAVRASTLKPLQRLVALDFADRLSGDERIAWNSLPDLCQRTGMSRTAAATAVRQLVAAGWLVVAVPARQQRSPRYLLQDPRAERVSSADTLRVSSADTLRPPRVSSRDTRVSSRDTRVSSRDTEPVSIQTPSSSLAPRRHAANLLGWAYDDDRLLHLDQVLGANDVRSPIAWLTRCHQNGDLDQLLTRAQSDEDDQAERQRQLDLLRCEHRIVNGKRTGQCTQCVEADL